MWTEGVWEGLPPGVTCTAQMCDGLETGAPGYGSSFGYLGAREHEPPSASSRGLPAQCVMWVWHPCRDVIRSLAITVTRCLLPLASALFLLVTYQPFLFSARFYSQSHMFFLPAPCPAFWIVCSVLPSPSLICPFPGPRHTHDKTQPLGL